MAAPAQTRAGLVHADGQCVLGVGDRADRGGQDPPKGHKSRQSPGAMQPPPSGSSQGWYSPQHPKCCILILSFPNPLNRWVGRFSPRAFVRCQHPPGEVTQTSWVVEKGAPPGDILPFASLLHLSEGRDYIGTCDSRTTIPMPSAQGPAAALGHPGTDQKRGSGLLPCKV